MATQFPVSLGSVLQKDESKTHCSCQREAFQNQGEKCISLNPWLIKLGHCV